MKIEMGESLFYSWLRHVKDCQIVQTNWKVSSEWNIVHFEELEKLKDIFDTYFREKYGYEIFKKNSSLSQIIQQGECDAIGICIQNDENKFYAVDVAFHGGGLNYGTRDETVMKVIAKSIRTAFCIYGYMDSAEAEIIFASPKITPAIMKDIEPCIEDINRIFTEQGFGYDIRVIANESFNSSVLQPILIASEGVADTSELFIRSYQMLSMFNRPDKEMKKINNEGAYKEIKIGRLANTVLRSALEEGAANDEEIRLMQTAEYSKNTFNIGYPLLVSAEESFDTARYYIKPLTIRGKEYFMCSQWYETASNNDRPYLEKWLKEHI